MDKVKCGGEANNKVETLGPRLPSPALVLRRDP